MTNKDCFTPTTGQTLILFANRYLPRESLNICTRIDIRSKVDEDLLKQAIVIASMRIPSLNLRFTKNENRNLVQYVSKDLPSQIEYVDATTWNEDTIDKKIKEWASIPFKEDLLEVQLYRIKLLCTCNGPVLFICVHHALMDAYAIMMLVKYIDKTYHALEKGKSLPEPMMAPEKMLEKENEYANSKKYYSDKKWFEEMYSKKMNFTEYVPKKRKSLKAKIANPFFSKPGFLNLLIEKKHMDILNEAAMKEGISPCNMFMLGIASLIADNTGNNDIVMNVIISRRSTLILKNSGCSLANLLPFRYMVNMEESFEDELRKITVALQNFYRHASFSTEESYEMLGKAIEKNVTTADLISVTYQPYFNMEDNNLEFTTCRVSPGKSASKFYLSIMPYDNTGNMYGNYEFLKDVYSDEEIREFHDKMMKFIIEGIKNPKQSLKEILFSNPSLSVTT